MGGHADVSVEYAHLYLRGLDEDAVRRSVRAARTWLSPLVAEMESRGRRVSKVVMLDDYFTQDEDVVRDAHDLLLRVCAEEGMSPDWVARESLLATSADQLLEALVRPPEFGDGSRRPQERLHESWLSNGQPRRDAVDADDDLMVTLADPVLTSQPQERTAPSRVTPANHAIHLDVEMHKTGRRGTSYSCPLLAAWWQLARLGLHAPPGLVVPVERRGIPFAAKRTITVLDARFIEVEHAVRTILDHVELSDQWVSRLTLRGEDVGVRGHLDRLAYLFVPSGWPEV